MACLLLLHPRNAIGWIEVEEGDTEDMEGDPAGDRLRLVVLFYGLGQVLRYAVRFLPWRRHSSRDTETHRRHSDEFPWLTLRGS